MAARSPYAGLEHIHRRTWAWNRPNGERVPLYHFNQHQVRQIAPALHNVDVHLRPHIKVNAKLYSRKPLWVSGYDALSRGRTGAITYPSHSIRSRSKVFVNPKIFKPRQPFNARGVVTHELAHAVGPDVHDKHVRKDFENSFKWHPGKLNSRRRVDGWKKGRDFELNSLHNRQVLNAHEDFAESFRTTLGEPMASRYAGPKQRHYMDTQVTPGRAQHLMKYYFN